MNLYLEPSQTFTMELFLLKLTAKSSIVDISRGCKYPSDERNALFSFSIKATLKSTTLGIRTCSTELLLWKNQKGLTCYHMTLCKQDSSTDILYEHSSSFWTSYFTKQLRTTDFKAFLLFRMSNDCCFHREILQLF